MILGALWPKNKKKNVSGLLSPAGGTTPSTSVLEPAGLPTHLKVSKKGLKL